MSERVGECARTHIRAHRTSCVYIVQSTKRINTSCIRRHRLGYVCSRSMPCDRVCVRSARKPTAHIVAVGGANCDRVDAMGIGRWKRRGTALPRCMCATFLSETNTITCAEHNYMPDTLYNSIFISAEDDFFFFALGSSFYRSQRKGNFWCRSKRAREQHSTYVAWMDAL